MTVLYGRRITVAVAGFEISEPRIRVEIARQPDATQAKAKVGIWNLTSDHEKRIHDRGGEITVTAGYPETEAEIFAGHVQRVVRARERLAKVVWIFAGDVVRTPTRLGGVTSRAYAGPVSTRQITRDLATDIGMPVGPLGAIPADATFTDFVWSGPSVAGLDALLKPIRCRWYESDGVLRVNRIAMAQSDAPALEISPRNGLVGTPAVTDEGAEIRTLLRPEAQLGSIVDLGSATLSGRWKVVGLKHVADNWQDETFVTELELRPL